MTTDRVRIMKLDKFWESQPMKYEYREPYMTGTGLKIYLAEEDY